MKLKKTDHDQAVHVALTVPRHITDADVRSVIKAMTGAGIRWPRSTSATRLEDRQRRAVDPVGDEHRDRAPALVTCGWRH
jgi:hypothetical protein